MGNTVQAFFSEILPVGDDVLFTKEIIIESVTGGLPIKRQQVIPTTSENFLKTLDDVLNINRTTQVGVHFATAGYTLPFTELPKVEAYAQQKGWDVRKERRRFINSMRNIHYIHARRCVYIDIDQWKLDTLPTDERHPKTRNLVFKDMAVAWGVIQQGLLELAIPLPTWHVSSGRGIHLYWALKDSISQIEWRYLQTQINLVVRDRLGIEVDNIVMKNGNGTMRIPTSYNPRSQSISRLTRISDPQDTATFTAHVEQLIPRVQISLLPELNTEPTPIHLRDSIGIWSDELSLYWGLNPEEKLQWDDVINPKNGCGFMRHCATDGRKTLTYHEWASMISVAQRCENGKLLIHELSKDHSNYSFEETESKLSFASVYSCETISGLSDGEITNPHCRGCRYIRRGKSIIKNPLAIARNSLRIRLIEDIEQQKRAQQSNECATVIAHIIEHPEHKAFSDAEQVVYDGDHPIASDLAKAITSQSIMRYMPDGFNYCDGTTPPVIDGRGHGIYASYIDSDDKQVVTRITTSLIYLTDAIRDSHTNAVEYDYSIQQADGKLIRVRVAGEVLFSDIELGNMLARHGVGFHRTDVSANERRYKTNLLFSYLRQSMERKNVVDKRFTNTIKQFGWLPDKSAFLLGDWLIYGNHKAERAFPNGACSTYTDAMTPRDTARVQQWKQGATIYAHQGMEAGQFILGVSLATPILGLVQTADAQGALINVFSTVSGVGKTTLCHSALSIWGRPTPAGDQSGLGGVSNDTAKSRTFGMSVMQNIPYYMDETTELAPDACYSLVYQITQGQDRRRMKQSGVEMHDTIGGWNLVTMTSSNKSLVEKLHLVAGASTDAVHARVFEIDMAHMVSAKTVCNEDGSLMYNNEQIQEHFRLMCAENYAIIGQDFLMRSAHDHAGLLELYHDVLRKLNDRFHFQQYERFWANTATIGIAGIILGCRYGYWNYDVNHIVSWLGTIIASIRQDRIDHSDQLQHMLEEYITNHYAQSIISPTATSASWASYPSAISYRNNIYEWTYMIPVKAFTDHVMQEYKWTAKEIITLMTERFGQTERYRFLNHITKTNQTEPTDIPSSGYLTAWRVPHADINTK